jgi:hypothetical protein
MAHFLARIMTATICLAMITFGAPSVTAELIFRSQVRDASLVYVVVNASIYDQLRFHLERYVSDIENIGLNPTILPFGGGNHKDIKAILVNASSKGLVGCLFVGDLPNAYYEDWKVDNETYPIDLFFMDLDGNWTDADNNGKYENHTGNRSPEIWVGRLKTPSTMEDEVSLLKRYFDRNHEYRTGNLTLPDRALLYIDDPWSTMNSSVDSAVALAYSNRTLVYNKTATEPKDYLNRLTQNWSMVQVMAHGSGISHTFETNDTYAGSISSEDIRKAGPRAFFYNLFSCRSANYSLPDYIAGSYVFGSNYSLAAIGPADSGGMWIEESFYSNFSQKNMGFSFLQWLKERIAGEDKGSWYDRSWFYGLTIIGDPTLSKKPDVERPETREIDIAIKSISPCRTVVSNQTCNTVLVELENQGNATETFNFTLFANEIQIGNKTLELAKFRSAVLEFQWNATGFALTNYTLRGCVMPLVGETDLEDNTLVHGTVKVSILGDINADGKVNILDAFLVAEAFDSNLGDATWNPNADIIEDETINILDIFQIAKEFGKTV